MKNNNSNNYFLKKYKNFNQNDKPDKEKAGLSSQSNKNKVDKIAFEKLEITDQKNNFILPPKKRLAAFYFIVIGIENASVFLKHFTEQEIFKIINELLSIENITEDDILQLKKNFGKIDFEKLKEYKNFKDFTRLLLQKSFGVEKGSRIYIKCLEEKEKEERSFSFLNQIQPRIIAGILLKESDTVSSIIMSLMDSKHVAKVIKLLPKNRTVDILKNISKKIEVKPEVLDAIIKKVKQKVDNISVEGRVDNKGKEKLIEILRLSDYDKALKIIKDLEKTNPELANELKESIFTFDDILHIPKKSLDYVLAELSDQDIAYILKGASSELMEKFFRSLTKKRRNIIIGEMNFLGKVKKKDVDERRKGFITYLKELEGNEEIILNPDNEIYVE